LLLVPPPIICAEAPLSAKGIDTAAAINNANRVLFIFLPSVNCLFRNLPDIRGADGVRF
jgi:hypothetical protein